MSQRPEISVVLCTYNRGDRIESAVASVLAQTFDDFELVVVNDGSADDTAERLASIRNPRVRVINRPNGGLSAARNTGIENSWGRFLVFLDDDDPVEPGWLAGLHAGIGPQTGISSCACTAIDEHGQNPLFYGGLQHPLYPGVVGTFLAGTFAIDADVVREAGGYAEDLRVSHQSELLLRTLPMLASRGQTSSYTDQALITIERRSPANRPLSQPADLLHGAEYILEHHTPTLARIPSVLADYRSIAGVNAAKCGDYGRARKHLGRAARLDPTDSRRWLRLAASWVPPVGRRRWPAVVGIAR